MVIVEVDEEQHKTNARRCELVRMAEVSMGYGGLPVHWIRYNPDEFKMGKTRAVVIALQERLNMLKAQLMKALASPDYGHFMVIEYLFYDTPGLPGLTPGGQDIGADGEIQCVKLVDMNAFHTWCAACGVKVD